MAHRQLITCLSVTGRGLNTSPHSISTLQLFLTQRKTTFSASWANELLCHSSAILGALKCLNRILLLGSCIRIMWLLMNICLQYLAKVIIAQSSVRMVHWLPDASNIASWWKGPSKGVGREILTKVSQLYYNSLWNFQNSSWCTSEEPLGACWDRGLGCPALQPFPVSPLVGLCQLSVCIWCQWCKAFWPLHLCPCSSHKQEASVIAGPSLRWQARWWSIKLNIIPLSRKVS